MADEKSESKRIWLITIVVIVCVLLACAVIGLGCYFGLRDGGDDGPDRVTGGEGSTDSVGTGPASGSPETVPLASTLSDSYDYIVVGAGSAGSVLAARLSESPGVRVLLVEAGPDDRNNSALTIPFAGLNTFGTPLDWSHTTLPDDRYTGLNGNASLWRSGKVLGGTSSINAMIYCRGSPHDFDRWASSTGDSSWDYRHVLSYFIKAEGEQGDLRESAYHGKSGPLSVSRGATVQLPNVFLEAARQAGYAVNPDYNAASMLGASLVQRTQMDGERMSTSRAYLRPALTRPNLDVVVNTHVARVVIRNGRAVGVELTQGGGSPGALTFTVAARSEVILSAGALGSPKLLLLSGVGPRAQLEALGIPVEVDLPVGSNLQDHLHQTSTFKIDQPLGITFAGLANPLTLQQYAVNKTGPYASSYGVGALFMAALSAEDKSKGWPQISCEVLSMPSSVVQMRRLNYATETIDDLAGRDNITNGFQIMATLVRPESRGSVYLRSSNPFDPIAIDTNYLQTDNDVNILRESINIAHRIADAPAMKDIRAEPTEDFPYGPCKHLTYNTTEYWRCQIKSRPISIYHASGTCKMGSKSDPTAVVDSQLRVKGIDGLRVVDASIMPWITSCNPNAAIIMIAEKAADVIKGRPPLQPTDL